MYRQKFFLMLKQKNFPKYLEIKKRVDTFAPAFREKHTLKRSGRNQESEERYELTGRNFCQG